MAPCQTVEEIHDTCQCQHTQYNVYPVIVRLLADALGVEPPVLYDGDLTTLFQSRVLVVDSFHQLAVSSHDVYLRDGNAHIIKCDALQVQFLNLPLQGFLAPHVVFVVAIEDSHQCHLWCLELHETGAGGVAVHEVVGRVVAGLEHGSLALQLLEGDHGG